MTTSRIRDVFIVIVIRLYYVFTKLRMYSREEAHSVSYIFYKATASDWLLYM